jgi:3-isopropylmalate/(R)-2-methylmalate dehydratase small subunit
MSHSGTVESRTFCLPVKNIDTDQIIPGQFLTTTEKEGLGRFCFYSWRFDENGNEHVDHPLKAFDPTSQQVLVAGSSFGCGSSREHAPWALLDFGFRAVISSQFADIFRSNSLKNGLLPVMVEDHVVDFLLAHPGHPVQIDINSGLLTVEGLGEFEFPLDPFSAYCLTRGIDQLDFLLENEANISRYEQGSETP